MNTPSLLQRAKVARRSDDQLSGDPWYGTSVESYRQRYFVMIATAYNVVQERTRRDTRHCG